MKKQLLFLTLFLSVTQFIHAQSRNRFRVGMSYQRTLMLDKQASPLKYQTNEKTILLDYSHLGTKSKFNAQLNGSFGDLFPIGFRGRQWYDPGYNSNGTPITDSSKLISRIYHARLHVSYGRSIGNGYSKIGKVDLRSTRFLGVSLNNQLFYSNNIVRTGWLNAASFNGDFDYIVQGGSKHSFVGKLSVPLVAYNTRLPYHNTVSSSNGDGQIKTILKQGSRMAWLGDFQNIQVSASYEYAVTKSFGLGIHYSAQWLKYMHREPIRLFQNNIGVVASFK